jgi:hypothetical protein
LAGDPAWAFRRKLTIHAASSAANPTKGFCDATTA